MEIILILSALLSVSIFINIILKQLSFPNYLSFLIAGFLVVNFTNMHFDLSFIGKLGILFLLFNLGLEISISGFKKLTKYIAPSLASIFLPSIMFFLCCIKFFNYQTSFLISIALSLSSTAIVIHFINKDKLINTNIGKLSVCALILQDIIGVFSLIFTGQVVFYKIFLGLSIYIIFSIFMYYFIPKILYLLHKFNCEMFFFAVLCLFLIFVYVTELFGLSMEIGAMTAGMIISESKFTFTIEAYITILKDLFIAVFFLTIGASINIQTILLHWKTIFIGLFLFLLIRFIGIFISSKFFYSEKKSISFSLLMNNGSETSLLILQDLFLHNMLNQIYHEILLSIIIIAMLTSPIFLHFCDKFIQNVDPISSANKVFIFGIKSYSVALLNSLNKLSIKHIFIDTNINDVIEMRSLGASAYIGSIFNLQNKDILKFKNAQIAIICENFYIEQVEILLKLKKYYNSIFFLVITDNERIFNILSNNQIKVILMPSVNSYIIDEVIFQLTGDHLKAF
jgi:CPA2 family monovalent cation:H+ antiporter-2